MVAPDLVKTLEEFRSVKITMPEHDTLADGRDLLVVLQQACPFPLAYVQRIGGDDPCVIVWRMRDANHAMEHYRVSTHQA